MPVLMFGSEDQRSAPAGVRRPLPAASLLWLRLTNDPKTNHMNLVETEAVTDAAGLTMTLGSTIQRSSAPRTAGI